jgi:translation initiation factor 6 (eIF-6)
LLSSLFESIEQVLGVSVTAPQTASATAPATAAVTAAAGAAVTPNASTSFSGIGAHINTKA